MTLRELSDHTGISASHLNRIERGERSSLSKQALADLVNATGWSDLWSAAGCIPPAIEKELVRLGSVFGASDPEEAVRVLRRLAAAECARRFLATHAIPERGMRLDVRAAAAASGLDVTVQYTRGRGSSALSFAGKRSVVVRIRSGTPGATHLQRFLYAHAVGHRLLGHQACAYPRTDEAESEATDIACMLLMPDSLLERAARRSLIDHEPWEPAGNDLVAEIAATLAVPLWVAVRRLSDYQILEIDAEAAA